VRAAARWCAWTCGCGKRPFPRMPPSQILEEPMIDIHWKSLLQRYIAVKYVPKAGTDKAK